MTTRPPGPFSRFSAWAERRLQVREPGGRRKLVFYRHPLRFIPGEDVVLAVPHHWIAYISASAEIALGGILMILWTLLVPLSIIWVPIVIAGAILAHGFYRFLAIYRDCFYITNSRVLRVSGVFSREVATMPIGRVLDVAVELPYFLRPWRVGHLVIETAAQEQALRRITTIYDPEQAGNVIHQVRQAPPPPPTPVAVWRRAADHPRRPGRPSARPPRAH